MNCIVCALEIPKENWWRNAKYCSRKCYLVKHKAKKEIVQCPQCEKSFERPVRKTKKMFCSLECRYNNTTRLGHRYLGLNGYFYIKTGPSHYDLEHRLILEKKLGRKLRKGEHGHHINSNKQDNIPENLEIYGSNSAHIKYHNALYGGKHPKDSPKAIRKRVNSRWTKYWQGIKPNKCQYEGCKKPHKAKRLCSSHYEQFRKGKLVFNFGL